MDYTIVCVPCEDLGEEAIYLGESGKNAYSRGKKHLDDCRAGLSSGCKVIYATMSFIP